MKTQIRNVLAGVDFSPCSMSALAQAARISRRNHAALHVLHVIDGLIVDELASATGESRSALERQLVQAAGQDAAHFLSRCADAADARLDVRVGSLLQHTLRRAKETDADLIVLGVFGASGPSIGASVFSTKCVRKAKAPVLLVAEAHAAPYRTVLACVDFSPTSRRALEHAIRMARQDGGSLRVLHVYYGPWNILHYRAPTPQAAPAFKKQYMDRLEGMLEGWVAEYRGELSGINVTTELHEHPSYGRGIIRCASEWGADLVVLGTTGRRNLRSLVLGSTAERVLREIPCSVLAVKPV